MKLVTYADGADWRSGLEVGGCIHDTLAVAALAGLGSDASRWLTTAAVLRNDKDALDNLGVVAGKLVGELEPSCVGRVGTVLLGPPIMEPGKIICVGHNYAEHVAEVGKAVIGFPTFFAKFSNSLVGPTDDIVVPRSATEIDYEGELAIVIGRAGRDVDAAEALSHVAGVMVVNDVTSRELQRRTTQWLSGKAIDTFLPCGPALVTLDELGDIQKLALTTRLNGELVQSDSTASMLFPVGDLIATLSRTMRLEPGDIICTGTPSGIGSRREPPRYLHDGDVVEVAIEGVGSLRNRVRSE